MLTAAVLKTKGIASARQPILRDSSSRNSSNGKAVKWTDRYLVSWIFLVIRLFRGREVMPGLSGGYSLE